ncbi:MAG: ABC transporter family substrate-binding protein [Actinobacteria bacterium]|nr:ABC transporter family substrate-binding protein [Actinomycetota bacterium]NDF68184.1 ABC transporter family substrate-binding protein [Actinomycetota bacterium]NDG10706.1 ABC transporter family substrate-binding protein [Actinomycetota bacterium]
MKVKTMKKAIAAAFALALVAPMGLGNQASAKEGGSRQINEKPVSELKQGGTFRFVQVDICPNFNTSAIEGNLLNCSQVMGTMLPSYIYFDKDARIQIDTNYATSIKASRVGGKQTVTYDLNPKAKWSDGTTIGLKDFVGMWNAQKGVDKAYKITSSVGYEKIESIKKGANPNQVVVTFKETYADWQPLFGALKPASLTKDAATFNDAWKNGPTVTAGPFRPASGKGASQFLDKVGRLITVERDPKWWGDKPVLDKIVFKALPQAAQIAALLNGEIDYMDIGNDINALKQARENSKISVRVAKAPTHEHFTFGPPTVVTKEVAVRQAIMLSIDRQAIATAIQGIVDPKVKPNNNHVFLDGTACTQDNTGKLGKRDVAAAQKLLTDAGWVKGADGIYAKGGNRLSVKLIYPSNNDNRRDTVLLASAQAKEAGIELVPTLIPTADYFGKYVLVSNFEMALFAWVGTNFPISSVSNILRVGAAQNFGNIGSAEIDGLFAKANSILDPKKRCELANQADAKAFELVHSITLFQRNNVVGVPKNVANFGAFGFTSLDWTKVGFTK